jgi:hypothetical protein
MEKDEICQPLHRKDLQHMLSYESAEQDGKEDENLSAVQWAQLLRRGEPTPCPHPHGAREGPRGYGAGWISGLGNGAAEPGVAVNVLF